MRFAVFTASTPDWTPAEVVGHLSEQGWDGVEWRITNQSPADTPGFWAGNRATWPLDGLETSLGVLKELTRGAGLEFSSVGGYVSVADHRNADRMLAATAALSARQVRLTIPRMGSSDYRTLFAATRNDLERAVTRAADLGVKVLVELHPETIVPSASAALRLVDGLDPAYVGVIHDLGNLLVEGYEATPTALQLLGPYLAHVHVKNPRWIPGEPEPDGTVHWRHEWAPLREGVGDIPGYLRDLQEAGYDGWIVSEDFSTDVPLQQRLRDNLAYLRAAATQAETPAAPDEVHLP